MENLIINGTPIHIARHKGRYWINIESLCKILYLDVLDTCGRVINDVFFGDFSILLKKNKKDKYKELYMLEPYVYAWICRDSEFSFRKLEMKRCCSAIYKRIREMKQEKSKNKKLIKL